MKTAEKHMLQQQQQQQQLAKEHKENSI